MLCSENAPRVPRVGGTTDPRMCAALSAESMVLAKFTSWKTYVAYERPRAIQFFPVLFEVLSNTPERIWFPPDSRIVRGLVPAHYIPILRVWYDIARTGPATNESRLAEIMRRLSAAEALTVPFVNVLLNKSQVHGTVKKWLDQDRNLAHKGVKEWRSVEVNLGSKVWLKHYYLDILQRLKKRFEMRLLVAIEESLVQNAREAILAEQKRAEMVVANKELLKLLGSLKREIQSVSQHQLSKEDVTDLPAALAKQLASLPLPAALDMIHKSASALSGVFEIRDASEQAKAFQSLQNDILLDVTKNAADVLDGAVMATSRITAVVLKASGKSNLAKTVLTMAGKFSNRLGKVIGVLGVAQGAMAVLDESSSTTDKVFSGANALAAGVGIVSGTVGVGLAAGIAYADLTVQLFDMGLRLPRNGLWWQMGETFAEMTRFSVRLASYTDYYLAANRLLEKSPTDAGLQSERDATMSQMRSEMRSFLAIAAVKLPLTSYANAAGGITKRRRNNEPGGYDAVREKFQRLGPAPTSTTSPKDFLKETVDLLSTINGVLQHKTCYVNEYARQVNKIRSGPWLHGIARTRNEDPSCKGIK